MNRPDSEMRRRLLSRSAYIFCIRAVPGIVVLLISILFARRLPQTLNGSYQRVWLYLTILVAIGSAGLPALAITHSLSKLQRWLRGLKARQLTLFALANCGMGALFAYQLRTAGIDPVVLSLLYLAQLAALLSETFLVIRERFKTLVVIVVLHAAAFTALHLAFLHGGFSMNRLFGLVALLMLLRAALQSAIGIRLYFTERSRLRPGYMPLPVRRQWQQLGIYDISQLVFRYIDKLLISWLIGPAAFAVYFYGTMDIPVLPLLLGAAGAALLRQLAAAETTVDSKIEMLQFSGTTLARIVFPIFAYLFCFRSELIIELFGPKYAAAIPLFAISVSAIPLRAYNFTALLQHLNRVRIINTGALLDLALALGLAYPLYLWLGLPGVALAFTACSYVQAGYYLYHSSRLLQRPVLDLIPGQEWIILLVVYYAATTAIRAAFLDMMSARSALILGAAVTALLIGGSLYPIIFRKRDAP